jgi:CIC family chloride channel protein
VPLGSRTRAFATDAAGRYVGVVDIAVAHDPDLDAAVAGLVAGDLATHRAQYLLPGMNIQEALARFEAAELETLPVLSDAEGRRIQGYLTEAYALRRYTTEMERQRKTDLGVPDPATPGL